MRVIKRIKNFYHLLQSLLANIKYNFPAEKLTIIGVTGTDGKTTTTSMIYHVLSESGINAAMISTINAQIGDEIIDTGLHVTTPEPWDLPKILRKMVDKGITHVVIESTSSGLEQNRLFGVKYDSSTITNIGVDHLEDHGTWENYAKAKYKIIQKTKKGGLVVLNKDHNSSDWLEQRNQKFQMPASKTIEWYSINELVDKKHSVDGIEFGLENKAGGKSQFVIPVIGEYNFSNVLGVVKVCSRYLDYNAIIKSLKTFKAPEGRMQVIQKKPFTIIIDFAHTPSSLESALDSVIKIKPAKNSKIITVFGCAGQRDTERRKMGAISANLADITIASLEDPRDEDVKDINSQIISYAKEEGADLIERFENHEDYSSYIKSNFDTFDLKSSKAIFSFDYNKVQNRIDAIEFSFKLAKEDDIVFITGKAHETSLAIQNEEGIIVENPYFDKKTVLDLLRK